MWSTDEQHRVTTPTVPACLPALFLHRMVFRHCSVVIVHLLSFFVLVASSPVSIPFSHAHERSRQAINYRNITIMSQQANVFSYCITYVPIMASAGICIFFLYVPLILIIVAW